VNDDGARADQSFDVRVIKNADKMSIFSLDSLRRVRQLHHKIDQMRYRH